MTWPLHSSRDRSLRVTARYPRKQAQLPTSRKKSNDPVAGMYPEKCREDQALKIELRTQHTFSIAG